MLVLDCDSSTSASQVASITGVYSHNWLQILKEILNEAQEINCCVLLGSWGQV
jgi:hypothetical protein